MHKLDLTRLVRFGIIGVVATSIHVLVVIALMESNFLSSAPLANFIAFVCVTTFSYFCNSRWSFKFKTDLASFRRFITVSSVGACVSIGIAVIVESYSAHYLIGVGIIVTIVPIFSYFFHSKWTFK